MSTDHMHRDHAETCTARRQASANPLRAARSLAKDQQQRRHQINWRLLAATIVVGVILVPSAYAWHGHQLHRNGSVFLQRAEALEAEGKWDEAADSFFSYIRLSPDGPDADQARIHLAQCYDHCAKSVPQKVRAVELYSTAIGLAPELIDLRRRRAELHFELHDDGHECRTRLGTRRTCSSTCQKTRSSLSIQARCTYIGPS